MSYINRHAIINILVFDVRILQGFFIEIYNIQNVNYIE